MCPVLSEDSVHRRSINIAPGTIFSRYVYKYSPEVVPTDQTLEASPKEVAPEVLSELDGLVHRPVPVPEVRGLRVSKVEPKALLRAVIRQLSTSCTLLDRCYAAYKPMAWAKFRMPSSVRTSGELRPDMMT